jgi:hypothetical protein
MPYAFDTPRLAEVIAASTGAYTAEVIRDAESPALGAWVAALGSDGGVTVGVVGHLERGSVAPNRRAVALGRDAETLQREMPQVLELLRTTIDVQLVAHVDAAGRLRQTLPPYPPAIHAFVHPLSRESLQQIGAPFDFLRTLSARIDEAVPAEDLLAAVLRALRDARAPVDQHALLVHAGRVLSRLYRDDHERLQAILRRI